MEITEALIILGLKSPFSAEELLFSYRKKLFAIHPDTSSGPSAGITVDIIKQAREVLQKYCENKPEKTRDIPSGKDGYGLYKKGMDLLGDAFDAFWKERLHYSEIPQNAPFVLEFRTKLNLARNLFAEVLENFPGGLWTSDAVEEIARINIWLGTEKRSGSDRI